MEIGSLIAGLHGGSIVENANKRYQVCYMNNKLDRYLRLISSEVAQGQSRFANIELFKDLANQLYEVYLPWIEFLDIGSNGFTEGYKIDRYSASKFKLRLLVLFYREFLFYPLYNYDKTYGHYLIEALDKELREALKIANSANKELIREEFVKLKSYAYCIYQAFSGFYL